MALTQLKFNRNQDKEFVKELRSRVNSYFKNNNISRYADWRMKFKTVFMFCLYFTPFALMVTGAIQSLPLMYFMWFLMSLGMAGIGLSVMHDANHGAYSKKPWVNKLLGFSMNFLGAFHLNWKIQHNILHHSFTNIEGYDEDISTPIMRFSPNQRMYKIFKFQAFYAPVFYGMMTLYWLLTKDFFQLARYKQKDILKLQKLEFTPTLLKLIFNKTWYLLLTLVLPLIVLPFAWWHIIIGFVMMHLICGFSLAIIFQTAHVINETNFVNGETGSIENNWAIHQMQTTANFARNSKVFSWFIGGLNFQIEHHLFPNICHIHFPKIAEIVRETAREFNVPYYEHRTFVHALQSHFIMLHRLGNGYSLEPVK